MIRTFRPWQIFQHLDGQNEVRMVIPTIPGSNSHTVFALETQLLIAAARIVGAQTILEVGTSMGYTTLHLARNTNASVLTVDIVEKPLVFRGTPEEERISTWHGTVQTYHMQCAAYEHQPQFDMIFIDGDHSYEAVKADTETALKFSPKVIAWHDYDSILAPDVKRFIHNDMAPNYDLIHVGDSWIALWFKNDLP